jgi:hypothetical protein
MGYIQVANTLIASGSETQIVQFQSVITTDDIYMLACKNITVGGSGGICDINPMASSTVNTTSDIDTAWIDLNASGTYQQFGNVNQSIWRVTDGMSQSPSSANFIMYLYNWYSSSEKASISMGVTSHNGSNVRGYQQTGRKDDTSSFNGLQINTNQTGGGGFQAGSQFTLYKVV